MPGQWADRGAMVGGDEDPVRLPSTPGSPPVPPGSPAPTACGPRPRVAASPAFAAEVGSPAGLAGGGGVRSSFKGPGTPGFPGSVRPRGGGLLGKLRGRRGFPGAAPGFLRGHRAVAHHRASGTQGDRGEAIPGRLGHHGHWPVHTFADGPSWVPHPGPQAPDWFSQRPFLCVPSPVTMSPPGIEVLLLLRLDRMLGVGTRSVSSVLWAHVLRGPPQASRSVTGPARRRAQLPAQLALWAQDCLSLGASALAGLSREIGGRWRASPARGESPGSASPKGRGLRGPGVTPVGGLGRQVQGTERHTRPQHNSELGQASQLGEGGCGPL